MTTKKKTHHQDRRIRVRSVRKDPPDLKKLAGALIALAQAQAEAEAEAEANERSANPPADQTGDAA